MNEEALTCTAIDFGFGKVVDWKREGSRRHHCDFLLWTSVDKHALNLL